MPAEITAEQLLLNDIFLRYVLDPNEHNTREWQAYAEHNPISPDIIEEATTILGVLSPAQPRQEVEEEVQKLKEALLQRETIASTSRTKTIRRWAASLAAAVVIIVAGGVLYLNQAPQHGRAVAAKSATAVGERRTLQLPDGSVAILNSGSTVSYAENSGSSARLVQLTGSAFFDVKKDAAKPFVVRSGDFETTALGTSFYVNADSAGSYAVRLLTGKVKIKSAAAKKEILLNPGERAGWLREQDTFTHTRFDTGALQQWVSGRLKFNNARVEDAFQMLEEWYNIRIIDSRPSKPETRVNGSYENANLDDVLTVMCFTLNCRFTYSGDQIIIE